MSTFIVRDSEHKEKYEFLDERLISTPSFAISECTNRTVKMAEIARDTIKDAISLFEKYSAKKVDRILKNEDELDMYEDKLGTYPVSYTHLKIVIGGSNKSSAAAQSETMSAPNVAGSSIAILNPVLMPGPIM